MDKYRGTARLLFGVCAQRGLALLVVLWVMAILMVTVLSFSFSMRTETYATTAFRDDAEKKFFAEAGLQRGLLELLYRRQNITNTIVLEGNEVWKVDGTEYHDVVGSGSYTVSIMGEEGKIDINKAPDVLLNTLLLNQGVNKDIADTIVDSLLDWRGPADLTRVHGAGNEYYESLPVPYKVKNAPFDTVEELLLVKGVTPDIFYGNGDRKGIMDLLTVYSGGSAINLNYAPIEVLMAIPGISANAADSIIKYRHDQTINNIQEVFSGDSQVMQPFITVTEGNVFTIDAVGYKEDGKAGYPVRATVVFDGTNGYKYLYYKSPAYKVQQGNG